MYSLSREGKSVSFGLKIRCMVSEGRSSLRSALTILQVYSGSAEQCDKKVCRDNKVSHYVDYAIITAARWDLIKSLRIHAVNPTWIKNVFYAFRRHMSYSYLLEARTEFRFWVTLQLQVSRISHRYSRSNWGIVLGIFRDVCISSIVDRVEVE